MQSYLVSEVLHYCNITTQKCQKIVEHMIDYYDLTFVLDGELVYYGNGEKYVLHKNDAIFFKPQTLRARDNGNETVRYVSFNFYAFPDADLPFDSFMPGCITSNIRKLLHVYPHSHLSSLYHSKEKCANMLNYILYELLDTASSKCDNEHIVKILSYIEEHITEKISLQSVSAHVSLSKEYTSYIFKREMGKTLTAYVNERKLLLARELIQSKEMSLASVASYLGFENYNYFSRLFRRYLDVTPVSLRKSK